MKFFNLFILCFFFFLFSNCKPAVKQLENTSELNTTLENVLQKIFEEEELIGMSVLAIADKQLIYEGYFGLSNKQNQTPVNRSTAYRIASISKTVTAAAAMLLVEKGAINLDTDVNNYLNFSVINPYFPDTPITLRMLLNHTSSIVDGESYSQFSTKMFQEKLNIKELFNNENSEYGNNLFLKKKPGSYFTYSNVAWGIVGTLVEQISGKNFQTYCQENLFIPLEMQASFDPALLKASTNLATLYRFNSAWVPQKDNEVSNALLIPIQEDYEPGRNALLYAPQGGLRVSAHSLANFLQMLMNSGIFKEKQILKKETVDLMCSPQWTYKEGNGDTSHNLFHSWGLGIHRLTNQPNADVAIRNLKMLGHPGEAYGLISDMYFSPQKKKGFIFITNGKKGDFKSTKESAFYETEEKVFKALNQYLYK